jgi:hypothetical protein
MLKDTRCSMFRDKPPAGDLRLIVDLTLQLPSDQIHRI